MPRKQTPTFETENRTFPTRLRYAMELRGKNQSQLAKEIGVQRQTVSLYTTGQSSPDADRIILISKALNVSPNFLLGFTASPDVQPSAADELGLSEKAIDGIKGLINQSKDVLNNIFESKIYRGTFSAILCNIALGRIIIQDTMKSAVSPEREKEAINYARKLYAESYPDYQFNIVDGSQYVDFLIFQSCSGFEEVFKAAIGYADFEQYMQKLQFTHWITNKNTMTERVEGD